MMKNQTDGYNYIFVPLVTFDGPIFYIEEIKNKRFDVLNKEEEKDDSEESK